MGKILNMLLGRKPNPNLTVGEANQQSNMNDMLYPIQIYLNGIHTITERSGWDIERWNMKDVNEFMELANRIGGK